MADIGRALAGLGAAFKNEMPAFIQQVRQEDLDAERLADREMALAERRKKTMFQDAYTAGSLLKAGDYTGIADLMKDRIEILRNTNADPSHSIKKLQLAFLASTGDEGAVSELTRLLGNEISVGVREGLITLPALPSIVPASAIDEFGNITTRNPSGGGFTTTSTLSEGTEPRISKESLKNNMDYRKEFNNLQSVKDYANRRGALGIIEASASNPNAAGDMSLIFAYMRMLDPGSVVRTSEFELAAAAGSLPQRVQAQYESVKSGKALTNEQRESFVKRANTIYERATVDFSELYENYEGRARRLGLAPEDALVDYRFKSASEINDEGILNNDQGSSVPSEFTSDEWNALTPNEQDQARSFLIQRQQDRQDY